MLALHWDGHELRFEPQYSTARSRIDDRGLKIVGATGGRPAVGASQTALVKVILAGICSTDLQILKGYMGFTGVPGHEFVGSVSEGPRQWIGKRVVGEINREKFSASVLAVIEQRFELKKNSPMAPL